MHSGRRSGTFRGVKIALITLQSLAIIGAIVLTIMSTISKALVNANSGEISDT
jgi:hypothetical protein